MRAFIAMSVMVLAGCGGVVSKTDDGREHGGDEGVGGVPESGSGARPDPGTGGRTSSGVTGGRTGSGGAVSSGGGGRAPGVDEVPPDNPETRPGAEQPSCYDGRRLACSEGELKEDLLWTPTNPVLSVISVYESHGSHGFSCSPRGVFDVLIKQQGEHFLFLASYEPVEWNVVVGVGVTVEKVVLLGYNHMTSQVPPGVPVVEYTYEGTRRVDVPSASYDYPSTDSRALIRFAENETGLKVRRYVSAYCANRVVLD